MAYTLLSIEEVADYLHIAVPDVERLVRDGAIPFIQQGDRVAFRKKEVDAWAAARIMNFERKDLTHYHKQSSAKAHDLSKQHALMPELMQASYIDPWLTCKTTPSAIRKMVKLAETTDLVIYPDDLLERVEAREKEESTALPGGFALLHPHYHEAYMFEDSFVALGRSVQAIPFGAPDGATTDLFFLICCQDDRIHLHVIARLCMMCHRTELLPNLREALDAVGMLDALIAAEEEIIRSL